jgi:hypothetical protein
MERVADFDYLSGVKQHVGYALFRTVKTVVMGYWAEQLTGVPFPLPVGVNFHLSA